ncbi:hypothetical protein MSAN_01969900 [Mycena sanguinolenta]|uniref:Transmembrane protein n=1 Tax=Mycena sanguinolenta TaxID=230812 RepID=A0A8H7CQ77_9AGAR|nr:hypothetical protein MSAN_01969900 [Mycena sanguinolenta]
MRIPAIINEIKSFRLGYAEEQPAYPWRWTTPIVLCAFLFVSPFLALVNVPLSAYNIIQEFTYHPNDTLPAVFLANIVPSVLQNPTDSFTPQLLNVGYTIALDNYIFNYTISQAFDGVNSVSAFPYYNNPLSDSCDVANITVQLVFSNGTDNVWSLSDIQTGGTVACYLPTPFYLTWRGFPESDEVDSLRYIPSWMTLDFIDIFNFWSGPEPVMIGATALVYNDLTEATISITVHPCCKCEAILAGGPLESAASLVESPCSSQPAQFVVLDYILPIWAATGQELDPYSAPVSLPTHIAPVLTGSLLGNASISALSTAYGNLIQGFYNLVRLDLGVILENQIYNSPEMFNRTIEPFDKRFDTGTNHIRNLTSNTTLMAQWQQEVEFFQNSTRVPLLEYFQSVPRLKPLGSAVTSVFVSTFAMLSVMWTVFSLVAGALARKYSLPNDALAKKDRVEQSRTWNKSLENGMEEADESDGILLGLPRESDAMDRLTQRIDREGVQTRIALARISAALRKHGLMEDDWIQDDDIAVDRLY